MLAWTSQLIMRSLFHESVCEGGGCGGGGAYSLMETYGDVY